MLGCFIVEKESNSKTVRVKVPVALLSRLSQNTQNLAAGSRQGGWWVVGGAGQRLAGLGSTLS